MKKTFKRAGVAVLSMAMLLSMGAVGAMSANAATDYTVATSGKLTADSKFYVYKVSDNLGNLESGWTLPTAAAGNITYYVGKASDSAEVKTLAATLAGQTTGKTPVNTASGTALGTNFGLDDGYYLVVVEPNSVDTMVQPMLVQVKDGAISTEAATAKTQDLTLTKTINNVGRDTSKATTAGTNVTNTIDSTAVVKVGDTVSYTIATTMPKYAPTATAVTSPYITDSPTNLTDDISSIVVTAGGATLTEGASADYTVEDFETGGFKVTFTQAAVQAHGGEAITVTYNATVLRTATQGTAGNENTAKLVYNNDYTTGNKPANNGKEVQDKAEVFTAPLTIHKTDGGSTALKGASFTLKNGSDQFVKLDGTTTAIEAEATYYTTNDNTANGTAYGDIVYNNLERGTYTLTEKSGVTDYRALTGTVSIYIDPKTNSASHLYDGTYEYTATAANVEEAGYVVDNSTPVTTPTVTIKNPAINNLPGTGGIGTTLFTVGGAAIVLLAGAMFVVFMRKRNTEE